MLPTWVILLLAFALRIYQLDAVRAYFDFALPHSLGIHILESIADGRWGDLPVLGIGSGALLKNPIGASYFWAVIELFDRDPYIANVISVLCSVLAVAMMYDLGRRLFGRTVGLAAMFFTAVSPWGIFYARGTWIQGQLEFASIGSAWLIWIAFQQGSSRRSPRRLVIGLIFTALMMQTYLMTMGLIALVVVTGCIALLQDRKLLKPFVIGLGICVLSLALFLGFSLTQPGNVEGTMTTGFGTRDTAPANASTRLQVAQLALRRTLEDVSGLSFNANFTDATDATYAIRQTLEAGRGKLMEVLIGVGALISISYAINNKQRATHLQLLTWFGLPMLIAVALNFGNVLTKAGHYMLVAQPATALFAALPFGFVDWASMRVRRVFQIGLSVFMAVAIFITSLMLQAHVTATLQKPHKELPSYEMLGWYPLRTQRQLAALWHRDCKEVASETYGMLIASIYQTTHNVRELAARFGDFDANKNSDVWEIRPDGGTCLTRANQPPPQWADAFAWPMPDGITLTTYRSKPVIESALIQSMGVTNAQPLNLNLGWTLLALTATQQVRAGEAFSAAHIWRIDALPSEPYADWNYTLFAKLALPNGQRITLADHVPLPAPKMWRAGDYVLQVARLRVPENVPPGNYTLEFSLFDDKAMRNAAYFDAREPGKPIVVLEQVVAVR